MTDGSEPTATDGGASGDTGPAAADAPQAADGELAPIPLLDFERGT
ncbi:hypothetical protein [Haloarcula pellucida]|nr:hypothetical protein [Halomicroarcula pellucida]MBX0349458.1 hypothetical protein [Halomicroarcula pellucida]